MAKLTKTELKSLVETNKTIEALKAQIKQLETAIEPVKNKVISNMAASEDKSIVFDGHTITYSPSYTRFVVDSAKLKAEYSSVFESCKKESVVKETLKIK